MLTIRRPLCTTARLARCGVPPQDLKLGDFHDPKTLLIVVAMADFSEEVATFLRTPQGNQSQHHRWIARVPLLSSPRCAAAETEPDTEAEAEANS